MTQTVQRRNLVYNPADQGILSLQGPADSPVSPKMLQSAASVVFASLPGSGEACFHRSGDCQTAARYLDADWQEGCRFAPASPAEYVGHSKSLPAGFVLHHDEQPREGVDIESDRGFNASYRKCPPRNHCTYHGLRTATIHA